MMRPLSWRLFTLLTVLVLLLATSCSSGSSSLTAPGDSDESLMIVTYGDSLLTYPAANQGAIDAYAGMLEDDLGVTVDVQMPMYDYAYSPYVVDDLKSDRAQSDLAEADVVIIESPIDAMAFVS